MDYTSNVPYALRSWYLAYCENHQIPTNTLYLRNAQVLALTIHYCSEEKSQFGSDVRQTERNIPDKEIQNTYCADFKCSIY